MAQDQIASEVESGTSPQKQDEIERPSGWLHVGVLAAASALAGGLAAAWYYRKTLARLRQAENHLPESENVQTGGDSDDNT